MSFGINQGKDPLDFEHASQGKRFIAISIDWAIAWSTATLLTPNIIPENAFSTLLVFYIQVLLVTYFLQSSMGQFLVGVKIIDKNNFGRIGFKRTFVRTTLIILVLPAVFTKESEPYHNLLTNSRAIRI
jgi:uncharacterized RDD family membrane protein YckC